ncbi:SDR family NAD(P)-dependent oxidoreductase [Actinoalloteichus hymeniacidonis]|uniref:Ketoreductase domain-containing protein n=1 Tax=Actinoalloteichus hymeniacidonis TaxID=340345 RepID=A0AAC9HP12_9PSEU|nr:SDR family oxidoreductase [Actinoalloteichus hymeniacidonis]AOS62899.1 dehydrogenase of unknown specificity, short-chain alcohol dehydrogenase like [Actinoalloteichus hymeniacidonis]MBB5909068.1 3-oxoacyl-[acyl-carrier protein] reductase [Actinoalloteichus hymeniacidonis]
MDQALAGKKVVVTGGTRGIGRVIVEAFAREGAELLVVHRSPGDAADDLAKELAERGLQPRLVQADVTVAHDVERLAESVREGLGSVDVLVNNVGVDGAVPFSALGEQEWRRVLDHNITASYLVTHALDDLLAPGASVVGIGSSVALRGRPAGVHYTAAKAALIGFTRALCKELGPRGIRVNLVAPGVVASEDADDLPPQVHDRIVAMTALGRICRPEDVAGAVLFLAGDTSAYITGAILNVDGGI